MADFIKNTISYYTFAAICAVIAAGAVYFIIGRNRPTPVSFRIYAFIYTLFGVFIGGHLLFFIVGLGSWIKEYGHDIHSTADFIDAFAQGASGMVFYGGLFGALLALFIFCRVHHLPLRGEFNNAVTVFPLFHGIARIGCALTGCCYGIEYHGFFAMTYTKEQIVAGRTDDLTDFTRFPVQLLEAALNIALFALLLAVYLRTRDKYSITRIYLAAYALIRFLDEFLRGDAVRGIWGPFSTSQWISLAVIAVLAAYYVSEKYRIKKV